MRGERGGARTCRGRSPLRLYRAVPLREDDDHLITRLRVGELEFQSQGKGGERRDGGDVASQRDQVGDRAPATPTPGASAGRSPLPPSTWTWSCWPAVQEIRNVD